MEAGGGTVFQSAARIRSCVAEQAGGLRVHASASTTIEDCVIRGNRFDLEGEAPTYGGGLAVLGPVTVSRCRIEGNRASGDVYGNLGRGAGFHAGRGARLEECEILSLEGSGLLTIGFACLTENPWFCRALDCPALPDSGGDFRLQSISACLPDANRCGALIGARGSGCGSTPIVRTTWSRLKATFAR